MNARVTDEFRSLLTGMEVYILDVFGMPVTLDPTLLDLVNKFRLTLLVPVQEQFDVLRDQPTRNCRDTGHHIPHIAGPNRRKRRPSELRSNSIFEE